MGPLGDAVAEAGFEPNRLATRADDDEALRQLDTETRRLGHLPTIAELRLRRRGDPNFPGTGIFERLGPKARLAQRLADMCQGQSDLDDVLEIVSPLVNGDDESDTGSQQDDRDGFVYLLKSGRHYKLGRTNSVGRRGYELAIQLNQTQALSHPIRLRILELFTKDQGRTLAAESLAADLIADYPNVRVGQVAYHVAVLKDAQLIPAG